MGSQKRILIEEHRNMPELVRDDNYRIKILLSSKLPNSNGIGKWIVPTEMLEAEGSLIIEEVEYILKNCPEILNLHLYTAMDWHMENGKMCRDMTSDIDINPAYIGTPDHEGQMHRIGMAFQYITEQHAVLKDMTIEKVML